MTDANDRYKQILIVLVAARLIPWVQKCCGVTLNLDQVGDLFAGAMILWHSAAATFQRYFPPKAP